MAHVRTAIVETRESALLVMLALLIAGTALADAPKDGRIGYVLTERRWAVYSDDELDKTCPHGFNGGPRDQFAELFPTDDGQPDLDLDLAFELPRGSYATAVLAEVMKG